MFLGFAVQSQGTPLPQTWLADGLTDGEEKERPPILPPDLAASASPGAEKVTAATVAATASFLAMSVVKASHGLLVLSPSPPAVMRSGREAVEDLCCARVSPAVAPVPAKRAAGAGTKPEAGTHASRPNTAADLMFLGRLSCLEVRVRWEFGRAVRKKTDPRRYCTGSAVRWIV